jgi:hypothetical protein
MLKKKVAIPFIEIPGNSHITTKDRALLTNAFYRWLPGDTRLIIVAGIFSR